MSKPPIGIIGGTGLVALGDLELTREVPVNTPFGPPSASLMVGELYGRTIVFLPRHGSRHTLPPHKINYRANIWAFKQSGVDTLIAVAAVGGINAAITPQRICIPEQIIDYTWGREQTFFEHDLDGVTHIDFTSPYCEALRAKLIQASRAPGLDAYEGGTYAATQGPRLESAAEVDRLERDGCDIVGMTGMPEAVLAKELDLCYATCAVCANRAAGRGEPQLSMEAIERTLKGGMQQVLALLRALMPLL